MKVPYIFLFLFLLSTLLYSQELPPIQNYSPGDYQGGNQNWMISQAPNKHIYVANNAGLLEYNGEKWKLYESPKGTILRSVKVIESLIYTGTYMDFGYWEKDEFGNLQYISLSDQLVEPLIEDEQFWSILDFSDWVLFQSLDRIYVYNTKDRTFEIIEAKTNRAKIFKVGNTVYFQKITQGIFKIENGKAVLVSDAAVFQKNVLVGAFTLGKKVVFLSELGEFYLLEDKAFSKWNLVANDELTSLNIYSSLQLSNGNIILGTISNGIFQIDLSGKILRSINKEHGLSNNTVLSAFEDAEQNVWLGLDNGISMINLNSPFREFKDFKGRIGDVYAAAIFQSNLYIGTNQGLFYKPENSQEPFKPVENTNGQVWCLNVIGDNLFCGHNNGTFSIKENRATKISDYPGTWDIKRVIGYPKLLLQGNYSGFSVLENTNGAWVFRNKIEGFDISSRFFEFIDDHRILVNHEIKGIYTLTIDAEYKKVIKQKSRPAFGYGSSLAKYEDKIWYTSNKNEGMYYYDKKLDTFQMDTLMSYQFYSRGEGILGTLITDEITGKLWGFSNNNLIYVTSGKFNTKPQTFKIPITASLRRGLGVLGFECMKYLKEDEYLIGASDGYIILNLDMVATKSYEVVIDKISKESLKNTKEQLSLVGGNEFNYQENNFNFAYSVPVFDKYTEVKYQYVLEGMYDNWSPWSNIGEVSFKNLPHGKYTFKVRALIGNEPSKNIAAYSFVVKTSWFASNLAFIIYIILAIIIFVLVHKRYKSYYRKQQDAVLKENEKKNKQKKLKAQRKIVQIKNDKLKQEIESKNRELAVSTMSIIKKNEFLNDIKDQLKKGENNTKIKAVIKTIDNNINNEDDWKFFEDAFNNADKHFLKKIKAIHSDLTSNDLRLCAYLRLNLSSKEIAPLLNISVRSVEVKRYRLRKKMDLSHENSLTDYILNL
ncbi:helix-turn-helix and ligand-binding sensor domain-containing protein [Sediminicola arcticus]|uniref:Triple tyrosine motif-containing protein n=1 Tax=Sediminicola arcticus TaxID=1574308 RepID=A0ABV2SSB8_9FLAO